MNAVIQLGRMAAFYRKPVIERELDRTTAYDPIQPFAIDRRLASDYRHLTQLRALRNAPGGIGLLLIRWLPALSRTMAKAEPKAQQSRALPAFVQR